MGNTFLIVSYAVLWVGLLAYIGWVALRMRGVQGEVETMRDLVAERERQAEARATKLAQSAKLATQAAPAAKAPKRQPGATAAKATRR